MSKISSFLKSKRKPKKQEETEAPVEPPKQEEWHTEDVDVEIVPVSVPKVEAGSEFEDEEIELPSTKVRGTFEWRRSEEEMARLEAKRKEEERRQREIDERRVLTRKTPGINPTNWASLEQSASMSSKTPTVAGVTGAVAAPSPTGGATKKTKERKAKSVFLLQHVNTAEVGNLSCKDIWAVVEPWDSTEHTWPYTGKDLVA